MGPNLMVMPPPAFDEHFGFGSLTKPFHVQTFVPNVFVEAFVEAVFSGLARVDECGIDTVVDQPF